MRALAGHGHEAAILEVADHPRWTQMLRPFPSACSIARLATLLLGSERINLHMWHCVLVRDGARLHNHERPRLNVVNHMACGAEQHCCTAPACGLHMPCIALLLQ